MITHGNLQINEWLGNKTKQYIYLQNIVTKTRNMSITKVLKFSAFY